MDNKAISNIGYIWLCSITKILKENGKITEVHEKKINLLNAEKLGADIILF